MRRQRPNVERMELLGAEVRPVEFGTRTLKEATSEAIRDWITNVETTHYLIGSCVGPAPYPELVRELQAVIGREARAQLLEAEGRLPEVVLAWSAAARTRSGCSPASRRRGRRPVGVEAAGAASLGTGRTGRAARRALVRAGRRGRPGRRRALRSPPGSTTRAWARSTRGSGTPAARGTSRDRRRGADAFRRLDRPRASSPRSSPPTRSRAGPARGRGSCSCASPAAATRIARCWCSPRRVKTLVVYLMSEPETPELAEAAVEGGADMVELGFPFSGPARGRPRDPRGGRAGARRRDAHARASSASPKCAARVDVPLVPMTYASLLEAYGWERFAADARAAGATGLIVADLPAGERPELRRIQLVAPTSTDERLPLAAERDRRLALPRHADRVRREPGRALDRARRPRSARAGSSRTCRSTRASGSRRPSRRAPRPTSPTASSSARGRVQAAEQGAAALRDYVRSLRTALDVGLETRTATPRGSPLPGSA